MKVLLIFLSICFYSNAAQAQSRLLEEEQRIKDGAALSSAEHLRGHPLYPYLQYRAYRNNLSDTAPEIIVQFLQAHPSAPFAGWLAEQAFPYWLSQRHYSAIIDAYDTQLADESIECEYRLAQLASGDSTQGLDDIQTLWQENLREEPACSPLFSQAIQQGQLDQEAIRSHFITAIHDSREELAQYIIQFLSASDAQAARTWLDLKRKNNPSAVINAITKPYWQQNALVDILSKDAFKHTERVLAQALAYHKPSTANLDLEAQLYNRLTRALADKNDSRITQTWARIPASLHDKNTTFDLIAYYLRQHNWQGIVDALTSQLNADDHNAETHYWLAKAYEKLGQNEQSHKQYLQAAEQRDFFGFLAAEKLGQAYVFNDGSVKKDEQIVQAMLSTPEAYRMRIFQHLGLTSRAIQEWRTLAKYQNKEHIRQAALLASGYGWHIQAISTLAKEKDWNALNVRFPIAYESKVRTLAAQHNLNPATIYAIIRKESIFQPTIKSPAGALGLMQVMPKTAQDTAQRHAIPYRGTAQLTDIDTNLAIGTQYLADRLREFGHLAYAAAAYNAGPNRAKQWLNAHPNLPLDEWIAQIPFNETRDYVKRVLEYEKVYQYRLGLNYTPYATTSVRTW